jgi:hypothetical protein
VGVWALREVMHRLVRIQAYMLAILAVDLAVEAVA